jgi:glycine/D-amino acid oxidase-like deaminating enzyme
MTYGTIAGMLLIDLVQGRRNDWADTSTRREKRWER